MVSHVPFNFFCKLLNLKTPVSPIVPIILGDEKKTLNLSKYLFKQGYLVGAIRPPTVPAGTSRLRIVLSALHNFTQLDKLVDILSSEKE